MTAKDTINFVISPHYRKKQKHFNDDSFKPKAYSRIQRNFASETKQTAIDKLHQHKFSSEDEKRPAIG